MSRSGRLIVCVLALFLFVSVLYKGRAHREDPGGAAFLRARGDIVLVRLAGEFPHPGVYSFPAGVTVGTVTNMTLGPQRRAGIEAADSEKLLITGDILTLSRQAAQLPVITLEKMGGRERILFGIPLDPDSMGTADWEALPGIGPVLAARIVADRHKNGAFGSLEGVLRVPGVGAKTLARIRKYF